MESAPSPQSWARRVSSSTGIITPLIARLFHGDIAQRGSNRGHSGERSAGAESAAGKSGNRRSDRSILHRRGRKIDAHVCPAGLLIDFAGDVFDGPRVHPEFGDQRLARGFRIALHGHHAGDDVRGFESDRKLVSQALVIRRREKTACRPAHWQSPRSENCPGLFRCDPRDIS